MSTLIIKPADRQSIDFAETERVKSASSGAVVHSTDLNNCAQKDLSNVGYPEIVFNPNNPEGSKFDGQIHSGAGDRVVKTFISSDGKTWYRKWASGWKECGGFRDYTGWTSVSIPDEFAFATEYYSCTGSVSGATTSNGQIVYSVIFKNISTNGFDVCDTYRTSNSGFTGEPYSFYCCGY